MQQFIGTYFCQLLWFILIYIFLASKVQRIFMWLYWYFSDVFLKLRDNGRQLVRLSSGYINRKQKWNAKAKTRWTTSSLTLLNFIYITRILKRHRFYFHLLPVWTLLYTNVDRKEEKPIVVTEMNGEVLMSSVSVQGRLTGIHIASITLHKKALSLISKPDCL